MASGSKKVIYAALAGNSLIAITKFIAAAITGSSAMLSEGIHSLVDTGNQGLLLYGMRRAKKPADELFPFGHGKEIYFWSFVVAILIFAVGSGLSLYEGLHQLQNPRPINHPEINYLVLGLAIVFEGGAWYMAFREFNRVRGRRGYIESIQRAKDPSLFVVLFEDSAAMLGLVIAMVAVFIADTTSFLIADGIASILIGCILGSTAIWLAYETKGLLIGEAANPRVVQGIRALINKVEGVDHTNEVLTMHMGPDFILVNISLEFEDELGVGEIEKKVSTLDEAIKKEFPEVKRVFVEAEARARAPLK
jgi:cation diffusion facilitator family transporter